MSNCNASDVPVIWLLGKAQAGKTSIVAELTGEARENIGNGFQRATTGSRVYAFPQDQPVVRFLDTRGLEDEAAYDSKTDLNDAAAQAHLLLAVIRLEDSALGHVLDVVRSVKKRHPDWPVLVALTRLHDVYEPGQSHLLPYPFDGTKSDLTVPELSDDFRRLLAAHRKLFHDLPGSPPEFVLLDFTQPGSGIAPSDYGAAFLWNTLARKLPSVYEGLHISRDPAESTRRRVILPWAFAAAGADALPLPFIGGLTSTGLQARMVYGVADRFGLTWDRTIWKKFIHLLGSAFVARYGVKFMLRQGLKVLPGIGAAAVAVLSFGVTYALGEAAIYFCRELAEGREPDRDVLRQTYTENLERARTIWQQRTAGKEKTEAS